MTVAGRITRALALCMVVLVIAPSCGFLSSQTSPDAAPEELTGRTDDRIERIAQDVILVVRHLNINNLAFARQSLSPDKYRVALGFLIPEIQELSQQVVDVSVGAPEQDVSHLLRVVDPLARAAREFSRYVDTGRDEALAEAYSLLDRTNVQLESFLTSTTLAEGPALSELLRQAGRIELVSEPTAVSRVALGPFSRIEVAQEVSRAAAGHNAVVRQEGPLTVWLGPFRGAAEARAVAAEWRDKSVDAVVHEDTVYEFRATEILPVQGRTWRELVWSHEMPQPTQFIAVSPDGSVVLAGDTGGTVQRRSGQGEHEWTQTFSLPTYALAVTREGQGIFAAGVGAQALSGDGTVRWRDALETFPVILEQAAISNDGKFMAAATSNVDEMGQAFGFDEDGLAWFTSLKYHDIPGLNSFHLSPDGDRVALGGIGEGRYQVMVVNERGDKIMGSDLWEPVVAVALAGDEYRKVVVLTERHVSRFDIETQRIEWQASARGRALAISKPGDIIYVGGVRGIAAYHHDGRELWVQDAMPVSHIVANRDYLIGLSSNIRLVIVDYDGNILGTVSPLVPIRDYAVATDGDLLIVLDEENHLSAWRLPPLSK